MSGHVLGWPLFSLKIAPSHMGSLPPSNTWSLGRTHKSTSQTASRLVQPFLNSSHRVPILYNGPPSFPLKNCPFTRGSGSLFNTWFLGPTQVLIPNSILIVIINYYFTHITVKMLVAGEVIVLLLL